MKLEEKIIKRLNSFYWWRLTNEIVKYSPDGYNSDGTYCKDEWTDYSDIGKIFNGKIFTKSEYLEIEKRYIECAIDIISESQCKYLTIGYIADYINKKNYRYKSRIHISQIPDILQDMLRNKVWCVLVNLKKKLQIDIGWDYYMHVICPIKEERLKLIVESHKLYLNPRIKHYLEVID